MPVRVPRNVGTGANQNERHFSVAYVWPACVRRPDFDAQLAEECTVPSCATIRS